MQGHGDSDLGENDVEAEGHRHLRAGREQIGHAERSPVDRCGAIGDAASSITM